MHCPDCARRLEDYLSNLQGVEQAEVFWASARGRVSVQSAQASWPTIVKSARSAGFQLATDALPASGRPWLSLFATVALLMGWYLEALPLLLASYGLAVFPLLKTWLKSPGLDSRALVIVASAGCFGLKEPVEACALVILYNLGQYWEALASRAALRPHWQLPAQSSIRRLHQQDWCWVEAGDLRVDDRIEVTAGQCFPVDGEVEDGQSRVDESILTGETQSVYKGPGSRVLGGSLNLDQCLQVRVSANLADSTHSKIQAMVAQALRQKPAFQSTVDHWASVWLRWVFFLFLVVLAGQWAFAEASPTEALYRAFALLLLACPCALVLVIPAYGAAFLRAAARSRLVVRSTTTIEKLATAGKVVFDKSGTLTESQARLCSCQALKPWNTLAVLEIAGALEERSSHPLARAIVQAANDSGLRPEACKDFQEIPGFGVQGKVGEKTYALGQGEQAVTLWEEERDIAYFHFEQTVRASASPTVERLRALGLDLVILSGDQDERVTPVAHELGIEKSFSAQLPVDKLRWMEKQGDDCLYVGDGLNDAPAMARSALAISLPSAQGSLVSQQADVCLLDEDLTRIPWLIKSARRCQKKIRQQLVLVILAKLGVLLLALQGMADLWLVLAADVGLCFWVLGSASVWLSQDRGVTP